MSEIQYQMTAPVHPEKVVLWFLGLHHYWFDGSLGPNAFSGMHDEAKAFLWPWTVTGKLPPDKTQLEISLATKFQEWLDSSWVQVPEYTKHANDAVADAVRYHKDIPDWITEVALIYQRSPRPAWIDLARDINEAHNAHCEDELRARIEELEKEKAAIGAVIIEAAEDGCLRSRQVHCAERENRYLDWCVPCKAKFLLLR